MPELGHGQPFPLEIQKAHPSAQYYAYNTPRRQRPSKSHWRSTSDVQLSGKEITWILLVVDGLSREVILGEDFSKAHIKSRHISTNQIELQDGTFIPTYESANGKTADAHSSLVRILGTHTTPTRTSMMIPIITRKHIPHGHMMAIFVPSISYSKARLVSAEIINLQNRVGHILVDNFSQNPYTITPKTIGAIYEIQELKALTIQEYAEMRDKGAIDSSKTRAFPQPLFRQTTPSP